MTNNVVQLHKPTPEDARAFTEEARDTLTETIIEVAHDAVFSTQRRWEDAHERVIVATHDRDEALWLLHRDDIIAGRIDLATCGFTIDLSVWGGHLPRDPEVIHAYCVRDVGYIRANPIFIENRCTEVTRVTEISKIREITKVREVEKVRVVERVETLEDPQAVDSLAGRRSGLHDRANRCDGGFAAALDKLIGRRDPNH